MEFILGLDMLRSHQCTIDLHNQVLVIGGERAVFLAEKDISLIKKPVGKLENSQETKLCPKPPISSSTLIDFRKTWNFFRKEDG